MDITQVDELVGHVNNIVNQIRLLIPNLVERDLGDIIKSFDANISPLQDAIISGDKENISYFGMQISSLAETVGNYTSGLTESVPENLSALLLATSSQLKSHLAHANPMFRSAVDQNIQTIRVISETREKLRELVDEQEKNNLRLKNSSNKTEVKIVDLEQKMADLQVSAYGEIEKINTKYLSVLEELEIKKSEIDKILGHVSGRAVAGDYEKSASEEKKMADWLRWGSLGCMASIAFALGSSLFETFGTEFDWQKSIFRVALGFLLSVPAAYLARESAKHREQQYQHQQTSLDLKAISPFMASLPEEEQHKIKIQIASRVFAGRDFSKVSADPFPLNTQEIIIELIKKLEIPKHEQKAEKTTPSETAT